MYFICWCWSKPSTRISITDTKLCAIGNYQLKDNAKLLKQLESGFKRTINWNKYQCKKQMKHKTDILIF